MDISIQAIIKSLSLEECFSDKAPKEEIIEKVGEKIAQLFIKGHPNEKKALISFTRKEVASKIGAKPILVGRMGQALYGGENAVSTIQGNNNLSTLSKVAKDKEVTSNARKSTLPALVEENLLNSKYLKDNGYNVEIIRSTIFIINGIVAWVNNDKKY